MLPKEHRLRHEKDIKTLFAKGKSVFGVQIGLKYRMNSLSTTRFAIVVGTKVSKSAVVRNTIKRRIRAVLQKHLVEIKGGYDVLFLTKKELVGKTFAEIESMVVYLLKKTPIL